MDDAILAAFAGVALGGAAYFAGQMRALLGALGRARRQHSGAPIAPSARLAAGALYSLLLAFALYVAGRLLAVILSGWLDALAAGASYTL